MTIMNEKKYVAKEKLSVKNQTLATITAVVSAVALPQIVHLIGKATGMGTVFGELLLPMHFPIILVGLLAGPLAGAIAGLLGPLCSFALSGMPSAVVLPFMMVELCAYGLFAGMLRNVKLPTIVKVLTVQVAGRLSRVIAVAFAFYILGSHAITIASVWHGVVNGLTGIAIQLIFLPVIVKVVEQMGKHE
ncbi:MAG: ECF transporter S component [Lachnospiraceae bacterium]|nr:ECF transporter S component [Lachnospiraceae bacterium]